MGQLDNVMTRDDFYSFRGGPDVAYPLGAMLCEVVRREVGYPGLMQLYEKLSGSVEFAALLTAEDVVRGVAGLPAVRGCAFGFATRKDPGPSC